MIVAKRWVRDAVDVAMPSRALCAWTSGDVAYGEVVWS
jgi:hypothetical protein